MRTWLRLVGCALLLATPVAADTVSGAASTRESCASSCSTVTNSQLWMNVEGFYGVVFQGIVTGTIDAKLQNSTDQGVTWSDVTGASCSSCTSPIKWPVSGPIGFYRFYVGTCTGCTYTFSYRAAKYR